MKYKLIGNAKGVLIINSDTKQHAIEIFLINIDTNGSTKLLIAENPRPFFNKFESHFISELLSKYEDTDKYIIMKLRNLAISNANNVISYIHHNVGWNNNSFLLKDGTIDELIEILNLIRRIGYIPHSRHLMLNEINENKNRHGPFILKLILNYYSNANYLLHYKTNKKFYSYPDELYDYLGHNYLFIFKTTKSKFSIYRINIDTKVFKNKSRRY